MIQYTTFSCAKKRIVDSLAEILGTSPEKFVNREESPHENTSHSSPTGSLLVGMAAGAALGAVGTMAATQNQRQVKRTARKLAKGAEHAICQLDKW